MTKPPPARKPPAAPSSPSRARNTRHAGRPQKTDTPPAPQNPTRDVQKTIIKIMAGILLVLLLTALAFAYRVMTRPQPGILLPKLDERPYFFWGGPEIETDPVEVRNTLLAYLANPQVLPPDFLLQLNDSAAIPEVYDIEEHRLYFTIPREEFTGTDVFDLLTTDASAVTRGVSQQDGILQLGKHRVRRPDSLLFSFPADDLVVHPGRDINVNFHEIDYALTMQDLVGYHYNRAVYGGFYINRVRSNPGALREPVINAGAFVAYPGEPSLKELVRHITNYDDPPEQRAQLLLDFVTTNIGFDSPAIKPAETIKKPHETLMSKSGGHLDRAILLASLLEQTEISYLIVQTEEHQAAILVAGDFLPQRGATILEINGTFYHLANTSAQRFKIGSRAPAAFRPGVIRYIQRPGINSQTYDLQTGSAVN